MAKMAVLAISVAFRGMHSLEHPHKHACSA